VTAVAAVDAAISPGDFTYVADLVRERSSIVLEAGKEYLAETRLQTIARSAGLSSIGDLVDALRRGSSDLAEQVVDAMTTNETSFFRDIHPWTSLRENILPALIEARRATRSLTIWSAAASSGQEAFSIALTLREHFPELAGWDVQILATDISPTMLDRLTAGRFSQLEVNRGMPAPLLVRWFHRDGSSWVVDESLRRMVAPAALHLAGHWPLLPMVDLVFLRNVLIYFDTETKRTVLDQVVRVMRPDAHLLLGAAETLLNVHDGFDRMAFGRTSWYRPTRSKEGPWT
jgi:chemotaxis protein methyltransferase CheR